jgi:hypothetical protein
MRALSPLFVDCSPGRFRIWRPRIHSYDLIVAIHAAAAGFVDRRHDDASWGLAHHVAGAGNVVKLALRPVAAALCIDVDQPAGNVAA